VAFALSLSWTADGLPEWHGQERREGVIVLKKFTPAEAVRQAAAQGDAMTPIVLATARGVQEVTGDEQTAEARRYLDRIVGHIEQGRGATTDELEDLCRTAERHLDDQIPRRRAAMLAEAVAAARGVLSSSTGTAPPATAD
jgi:hypothetical protein